MTTATMIDTPTAPDKPAPPPTVPDSPAPPPAAPEAAVPASRPPAIPRRFQGATFEATSGGRG